ncbi:hypothetical protein JD844_020392, partial [Phrynosoma platyrhinos]
MNLLSNLLACLLSLEGAGEGKARCYTSQWKTAVFTPDEDARNKKRELRRRLREEARLHKLQTRDLDVRGALGHVQRNNSPEDEDLLALDLHQAFKRNQ